MLSRPWPSSYCRQPMQCTRLASPINASICLHNDPVTTCQRLVILSRAAKRHGSSVPGPMECRRRVGRRRMTYTSDATPPATHFLAALWGFAGEVDRTQWKWEAPKPKPQTSKDTGEWSPVIELGSNALTDAEVETNSRHFSERESASLSVVRNHGRLLQSSKRGAWRKSSSDVIERYGSARTMRTSFIAEKASSVAQFRQCFSHFQSRIISDAPQWQIYEAMNAFVRCLEEKSIARDIDNRRLAHALKELHNDLRYRSVRLRMSTWERRSWESNYMHPVQRAIWRRARIEKDPWSITNSVKVLLPSMTPFISIENTQRVAVKMASRLTYNQLRDVLPEVASVILQWISVLNKARPSHMTGVAPAVVRMGATSKRVCTQIDAYDAKSPDIHILGLRAYERSHCLLFDFLCNLPVASFPELFETCFKDREDIIQLKNELLSVVAAMNSVDDTIFLKLWQRLCPGLKVEDDVIIDRLISQGHFHGMDLTRRQSLKECISATECSASRIVSLISSAKDFHLGVDPNHTFLGIFLRSRGQISIARTIRRMLDLGLVVRHDELTPLLTSFAQKDVRTAWKLLGAFQGSPQSCGPDGFYSLANCPRLLDAFVNESKLSLHLLWDTLDKEHSTVSSVSQSQILSRKSFLCNLAWLLARNETRTNRSLVRGVTRCFRYFFKLRLPIPSSAALALGHLAITRKVEDGRWIGRQPTRSVIGLLADTKDSDLAQRLAQVATVWRNGFK